MTSPALDAPPAAPALRRLGTVPYESTVDAMKSFTAERGPTSADEIWLVAHAPVFTQGLAGKPEHLLDAGQIPVVQTNRGGQVTYHGPGQVIAYPLVDLRRMGIYVKEFVFRLEDAVLRTLVDFNVTGHRVPGAPGIYVKLADPFGHASLGHDRPVSDPFAGLGKIAALGRKSEQSLYVSRRGTERRDGSSSLRLDQPVRLCRAENRRSRYTGRQCRPGIGCRSARPQARRAVHALTNPGAPAWH